MSLPDFSFCKWKSTYMHVATEQVPGSGWVKNICINSELILTIVLHEGRDYCPPPTDLYINMFLIFVNLVDKNGISYFYLHFLY